MYSEFLQTRCGTRAEFGRRMGEVALELVAFIHWASWRWIWRLSSIGRVGAGTGSFHPFGTASFYVLLLKHGNIRKISEARVFFYIFRLKPRSNRKICEKFAICKEFYTGVAVIWNFFFIHARVFVFFILWTLGFKWKKRKKWKFREFCPRHRNSCLCATLAKTAVSFPGLREFSTPGWVGTTGNAALFLPASLLGAQDAAKCRESAALTPYFQWISLKLHGNFIGSSLKLIKVH